MHSVSSPPPRGGASSSRARSPTAGGSSIPAYGGRNPQFNRETLPQSLQAADIGYEHVAALGGFRRPDRESANAGWRNTSFRGYADYMQTATFAAAIQTLAERAERQRLAVMCAEAVPWRCHRSLIADALVARGVHVEEVISATRTQSHAMTSFAHVEGTVVTYPG